MGFLAHNDKSLSTDIVSFSLSNTYKYRYKLGGKEGVERGNFRFFPSLFG